ncbi:MAG: D-glycero-beta-D-manno-heptose 1,7-bisphosphate 7-phosphatase [Epsilonproteobacteria bacterium]|nr:D-glycero-beta-D-manno-heptose 1,7-bisphosphate 7-phosphatase [Campylobacterota bacterium]
MKAIFLDRDGVINVDYGYVHTKEKFKFIDGVFEALKELQEMGYLLIVITNQSGIGRGYYSLEQFLKLNRFMVEEFGKKGIKITDTFFCPHHPNQGCECRKPKPKMVLDAIKKYKIDPFNSWIIGDKVSDIEAGKAAGVRGILIGKEVKNLLEAVEVVRKSDV